MYAEAGEYFEQFRGDEPNYRTVCSVCGLELWDEANNRVNYGYEDSEEGAYCVEHMPVNDLASRIMRDVLLFYQMKLEDSRRPAAG